MATHSNAHALCAASRNLTDKQLAAIRESGGLVGVNYAVSCLREDGRRDPPRLSVRPSITSLILSSGSVTMIALGSDFDGAKIPEGIGSAAGTQSHCRHAYALV